MSLSLKSRKQAHSAKAYEFLLRRINVHVSRKREVTQRRWGTGAVRDRSREWLPRWPRRPRLESSRRRQPPAISAHARGESEPVCPVVFPSPTTANNAQSSIAPLASRSAKPAFRISLSADSRENGVPPDPKLCEQR